MSETLLEGHFVKIGDEFFVVQSREAFNYITGNTTTAEFTTSVATGSESGFVNIDVLDPVKTGSAQLYQIWMGVKDGIRYFVKIPSGTNRFGVNEDQDVGFIDNEKSPYFAMNKLYEFWLVEHAFPSVNADNDTGKTIYPKVFFEGMKYELSRHKGSVPPIYKIITIGGLGTKVIV